MDKNQSALITSVQSVANILLSFCGCLDEIVTRPNSSFSFRLADVAFEAQDEAIKLRQQLQDLQQAQPQRPHEQQVDGAAPEGDGAGGPAAGNAPPDPAGDREGGMVDFLPTAVEETEVRVMQLEIENWQTERKKQEAEKEAERAGEEAKQAKAALEQAQAKVS